MQLISEDQMEAVTDTLGRLDRCQIQPSSLSQILKRVEAPLTTRARRLPDYEIKVSVTEMLGLICAALQCFAVQEKVFSTEPERDPEVDRTERIATAQEKVRPASSEAEPECEPPPESDLSPEFGPAPNIDLPAGVAFEIMESLAVEGNATLDTRIQSSGFRRGRKVILCHYHDMVKVLPHVDLIQVFTLKPQSKKAVLWKRQQLIDLRRS